MATSALRTDLGRRLWQYQRERFPLASYGPLILVFVASALATSALLREEAAVPGLEAWAGALVCVLLQFLLMRIADEFKDASKDLRHRPLRPVPRGLVRLHELAFLALAAASVQLGLVLWLAPLLLVHLLALWAFLALTWVEFGCGRALERRPLLYMLSHLPALALLYGFAVAWGSVRLGTGFPLAAAWGMAVAFFAGVTFEIARKVRAPADERPGVESYTAAWGRPRATGAWIASLGLGAVATLVLARELGVGGLATAVLGTLLVVAAGLARRFVRRATPRDARDVQRFSAVWTVAIYALLGPVPLLLEVLR